jgi:hypothetical protein
VKNFLAEKIKKDEQFAKRCLVMLRQDQLMSEDLTKLFAESGIEF